MPYVKSTVHISRIAGTALKSFTHGYAQTVTALAAQNHNSTTPLADTFVGKFRKAEKSRVGNTFQNVEQTRQASTSNVPPPTRPETSHQEQGLDKYFHAWQKQHHRSSTKEWQPFHLTRGIEWQPPSVVPPQTQDAAPAAIAEDVQEEKNEDLSAPLLKRSYTTSALEDFGKAFFNDSYAEAEALEQVNNAIAEEIQKSKDDAENGLLLKAATASSTSQDITSSRSDAQSVASPATTFTPTESFTSSI